jgi:hypothetical protein
VRAIAGRNQLAMTDELIHDKPSEVKAVDGVVQVDGPDAVDVTLSPEAAEETSDRLLKQSFKARGQKRLGAMPHRPAEKS